MRRHFQHCLTRFWAFFLGRNRIADIVILNSFEYSGSFLMILDSNLAYFQVLEDRGFMQKHLIGIYLIFDTPDHERQKIWLRSIYCMMLH